jgi:hypothetical protein
MLKRGGSIVLSHLDEEPICAIVRNVVTKNSITFDNFKWESNTIERIQGKTGGGRDRLH